MFASRQSLADKGSCVALHPAIRFAVGDPVPVAVIPLDDRGALFDKAMAAVERRSLGTRANRFDFVCSVLESVGIPPAKRKARK